MGMGLEQIILTQASSPRGLWVLQKEERRLPHRQDRLVSLQVREFAPPTPNLPFSLRPVIAMLWPSVTAPRSLDSIVYTPLTPLTPQPPSLHRYLLCRPIRSQSHAPGPVRSPIPELQADCHRTTLRARPLPRPTARPPAPTPTPSRLFPPTTHACLTNLDRVSQQGGTVSTRPLDPVYPLSYPTHMCILDSHPSPLFDHEARPPLDHLSPTEPLDLGYPRAHHPSSPHHSRNKANHPTPRLPRWAHPGPAREPRGSQQAPMRCQIQQPARQGRSAPPRDICSRPRWTSRSRQ
jgi:hypothetical protein